MAKRLTPWWEAVRLRREITESSGSIDDIQMSLFKAVYGVAGERPLYGEAQYYGDITHPSPNVTDLMAKVLVAPSAETDRGVPFWQMSRPLLELESGAGAFVLRDRRRCGLRCRYWPPRPGAAGGRR